MNLLKNRNLILGVLLLIAASLYAVYVYQQDGSSLNDRDIAFAVEDTAAVDRVVFTRFIGDQEDEQLIFTRSEKHGWIIKGKGVAFQPHINMLLGTLSQLHVQEVLIEGGLTTGKELLGQQRMELQVFQGKNKVKDILIGREGKDAQGTLMMLRGSDRPFIVGVPGFSGYLNSRFTMEPDFWREKLLFEAHEEKLFFISIGYKNDSLNNVLLQRIDGKWTLGSGEGDPNKIAAYVEQFQGKVYAEAYVKGSYPEIIDRAKRYRSDISLCLIFYKPEGDSSPGSLPSTCVYLYEQEDNLNNYLGCIQDRNELMSIQHFVFDKYLVKREELL